MVLYIYVYNFVELKSIYVLNDEINDIIKNNSNENTVQP